MVPNENADLEITKKINKAQAEPAAQSEASTILETKYQMTPRQVEIARMIADGASNREIAQALFFSESMARYETVKIYERLRVKNRAQAAGMIRSLL
jgi:DNA-binding NarL/FixJ family response regulator